LFGGVAQRPWPVIVREKKHLSVKVSAKSSISGLDALKPEDVFATVVAALL